MNLSNSITRYRTIVSCIGGRWVPAIPLKAPIDVRWCCEHRWTPHVYPQGWDAWNYFGCTRCGAECEAAVCPEPGAWPVRRWLAGRIFPYGRRVRSRSNKTAAPTKTASFAEPILPTLQWLNLPRELSDRVRREYCCNGPDSEAYRAAVAVALAYWGKT